MMASSADGFKAAKERATFSLENDMWGGPASDRNYTMGVLYTRHLNGTPEGILLGTMYQGLGLVDSVLQMNTSGGKGVRSSWRLGSSNFTPTDIKDPSPIRTDRPYASLQYVGVGYKKDLGSNLVRETGFEVGVLGTNIGYAVQTAIHRVCCKDRLPQGWDNQIGDGGAATFLYKAKWTIPTPFAYRSKYGQVGTFASAGFSLGYYTRALGGLSIFYGATPADFRDLLNVGGTEGPPPIMPLGATGSDATNSHESLTAYQSTLANRRLLQEPPSRGFSVWINYEVSAFAYNQLLQGAWFGSNRVTYEYRQIEPIVHLVNVGVEFTFIPIALGIVEANDGMRIYWTQSYKTQDLKAPIGKRHYWGGLFFSWPI